ncbi:MAG: winged helix-turn-helix domain-containing protein [Candidatus Bathyarchaeota archaeon]|nr:winged helix-turn-helix domain-containing protein [Candidatus Bathyarchaeota archaeon]
MSDKPSQTVADDMEETKERHRRYLRAINNPVRRDILRAIQKGIKTIQDLEKDTGIDAKTLDWHLRILEHGYCVDRVQREEIAIFNLTQEGQVVDFMDK